MKKGITADTGAKTGAEEAKPKPEAVTAVSEQEPEAAVEVEIEEHHDEIVGSDDHHEPEAESELVHEHEGSESTLIDEPEHVSSTLTQEPEEHEVEVVETVAKDEMVDVERAHKIHDEHDTDVSLEDPLEELPHTGEHLEGDSVPVAEEGLDNIAVASHKHHNEPEAVAESASEVHDPTPEEDASSAESGQARDPELEHEANVETQVNGKTDPAGNDIEDLISMLEAKPRPVSFASIPDEVAGEIPDED